jgi:heat shock protein HslJ
LCFSLLVLVSALALVGAGCGGSDQSSKLRSVPWRWSGVLEGADPTGLVRVPSPENYLLRFDEDGSFVGRADCKSLAGTYSLSGKTLTLELGQTSKRTCGPDSLSDKYIELLGRVADYDVHEEGALALGLESDAGYMYFYAASN